MRIEPCVVALAISSCVIFGAASASAQSPSGGSRWAFDVGTGLNPSINGNVNSGAIGVYQGQTTAVLPQSYGDVYGTGVELRFGGGYTLNNVSELRGMFIWQSADADQVRLGDFGASSLYGQYTDYKTFGFDFGYRRYMQMASSSVGSHADFNAQLGVRHVGGLAQVDQLAGTGLDGINDNSARLTFPIVVGLRFRFK
jgi:hypothetical protein